MSKLFHNLLVPSHLEKNPNAHNATGQVQRETWLFLSLHFFSFSHLVWSYFIVLFPQRYQTLVPTFVFIFIYCCLSLKDLIQIFTCLVSHVIQVAVQMSPPQRGLYWLFYLKWAISYHSLSFSLALFLFPVLIADRYITHIFSNYLHIYTLPLSTII